jgi:hypothetical protein
MKKDVEKVNKQTAGIIHGEIKTQPAIALLFQKNFSLVTVLTKEGGDVYFAKESLLQLHLQAGG